MTDDLLIGVDLGTSVVKATLYTAAGDALAHAARLAKTLPQDKVILVNLSGRGDKDMHTVAEKSGIQF